MYNNEKQYELIKFEDGEFSLDVNVSPSEDTVWLTQAQMALLFSVNTQAITKHISRIYKDTELIETSTCSILEQNQFKGTRQVKRKIKIYNLDMIISVGYRVNSKRSIMFRRWATQVLKQYLLKGSAINEKRCHACEDNLLVLQSKVHDLTNEIELIKDKISPLSDSSYFNTKLILNNKIYEAISFLKQLFSKAINRVIIVDSYINVETLDLLIDIQIPITIYTLPSANITNRDIQNFNINHHLTIMKSSKVHDRFIIIDNDLYSIGSSLKDCGKNLPL